VGAAGGKGVVLQAASKAANTLADSAASAREEKNVMGSRK
jgi:hypothetical protein